MARAANIRHSLWISSRPVASVTTLRMGLGGLSRSITGKEQKNYYAQHTPEGFRHPRHNHTSLHQSHNFY
jgi:hypothetical protein